MFLALFWAYVGQPDSHIGWVRLMFFASINPTNPRTNLWNFGENCSAVGGGWRTQFFWIFFTSFLLKLVPIYGVPRIFWNYDVYLDFQQKARGIWNYVTHCICKGKSPTSSQPVSSLFKSMTSEVNLAGYPVTISTLPVTKKEIKSDLLPSFAHYHTIDGRLMSCVCHK